MPQPVRAEVFGLTSIYLFRNVERIGNTDSGVTVCTVTNQKCRHFSNETRGRGQTRTLTLKTGHWSYCPMVANGQFHAPAALHLRLPVGLHIG
jgi:hypothetical protein